MLSFEYYGLAAIFILAGGLILLLSLWPKSVHATFSQHAAATTISSVFYSLLFIVVSLLLYPYFSNVFNGRDVVDMVVTILTAGALLFQIGRTLFPETKGVSARVHRVLAGLSAGILLLTQLTITLALQTLMFGISFLVMIAVVTYTLRHRKNIRYSLVLQVVFYLAFFAPFIGLAIRN